ncbi:beta-ketoacyl-ACP synthase III [Desulfosarcina sp. OttesenSCG-928-A07]|nr:beta-ketoacyl-ACP synthase III [Desulfosarcina sp. OttesenSCG-928-G17]MDL2328694.1 beta-ketoacyl-ACP synthase III [Desulfosarcina sp. OttesenSCG-928-A07]
MTSSPSVYPKVVISGTGLWTPPHVVTNEELVTAYNSWANRYNTIHAKAISAGEMTAKPEGSAAFIEKAAGIKQRYVYAKEGLLDIDRMRPILSERPESALSDQAEVGADAGRKAMEAAGKTADDIDAVIVSCSYTQRAYPAIAIEVQDALGIQNGFAFDMLVGCSAGTFALHRAYEMVRSGTARTVLVVNPEMISPQANYCDRDSHFIFGDAATALVVEREETFTSAHGFEILSAHAQTRFSSNVRSNFGYFSRITDADPFSATNLFHQNGRRVFKEVCPMAIQHLSAHIGQYGLAASDIRRWWLHQANSHMNEMICTKLLGHPASFDEAPIILDQYANTASAGSLIVFHLYHDDLQSGDHGVICSFGAGYSIGSLILKKR